MNPASSVTVGQVLPSQRKKADENTPLAAKGWEETSTNPRGKQGSRGWESGCLGKRGGRTLQ